MVSGQTKGHELERLLPWSWKAEQLATAVQACSLWRPGAYRELSPAAQSCVMLGPASRPDQAALNRPSTSAAASVMPFALSAWAKP